MKLFLESEKYTEQYKLDLEITYRITDFEIEIPSDEVLEALSQTILSEISTHKQKLCDGCDFSDFEIEYDFFNESDGILTYLVSTTKKILGMYFVGNLSRMFKDYETIVYYNDVEYHVTINSILPMLRYIGES